MRPRNCEDRRKQPMDLKDGEFLSDVSGYGGDYAISTHGRVWSYARKGRKRGEWMEPQSSVRGYLVVGLRRNGTRKWFQVHRLVAEAYLTDFKESMQINHKDRNKTNNHLTNLETSSPAENSYHYRELDKYTYTSQYHGVDKPKRANKWRACIKLDGKQRFLGMFADELDAARAYNSFIVCNRLDRPINVLPE